LKSFKSNEIETFFDFVKEHDLAETSIHATGGGAHKYADLFDREFASKGVQVHKHDEMASMVNGLAFVLKYAHRPCYSVPSSSALHAASTTEDAQQRSYDE